MEEVIEIVKILIPALVVFFAVFIILKQFFDKEQSIREDELKMKLTNNSLKTCLTSSYLMVRIWLNSKIKHPHQILSKTELQKSQV